MEIWYQRYISAIIASFIISTVVTAVLVKLLPRLNMLDIPDERKIHKQPIPRLGGIAIFAGFVIPMVGIHYFSTPQKGIMLGAGITLIVGALDDIFGVSAVLKLLSLLALTYVLSLYDVVTTLPVPYEINLIITMLWLTGVTSAMNALDHMDGLAGGVAAIAASMFFLVSIQTSQYFWGLLSICLVGSLMGYLIFNRHPASIFMGDSGSFFLGFTLAAIGIMGGWSSNPVKAAIVPVAILSLPIFDLAFVIIRRRIDGTTKTLRDAIIYCGKDHIGHRLTDMGFTITGSVSLVYLISTSIAFGAFAIRHANTPEAVLILLQIVLLYGIIITFMHKRA